MKWEQDLVKDIRYHDERDDIDDPRFMGHVFPDIPQEFSVHNQKVLSSILKALDPKTMVEIGVHRNGSNSSTNIIHSFMKEDSIYLGIDLEDKSYLNTKNIHTIQCNSSQFDLVKEKMSSIEMSSIDFLFIDGWHSINQVLDDWEYTSLLSKSGIVAFHDTTAHPGPKLFLDNLDRKKWAVEIHCEEDFGIGYCYAKA